MNIILLEVKQDIIIFIHLSGGIWKYIVVKNKNVYCFSEDYKDDVIDLIDDIELDGNYVVIE